MATTGTTPLTITAPIIRQSSPEVSLTIGTIGEPAVMHHPSPQPQSEDKELPHLFSTTQPPSLTTPTLQLASTEPAQSVFDHPTTNHPIVDSNLFIAPSHPIVSAADRFCSFRRLLFISSS